MTPLSSKFYLLEIEKLTAIKEKENNDKNTFFYAVGIFILTFIIFINGVFKNDACLILSLALIPAFLLTSEFISPSIIFQRSTKFQKRILTLLKTTEHQYEILLDLKNIISTYKTHHFLKNDIFILNDYIQSLELHFANSEFDSSMMELLQNIEKTLHSISINIKKQSTLLNYQNKLKNTFSDGNEMNASLATHTKFKQFL